MIQIWEKYFLYWFISKLEKFNKMLRAILELGIVAWWMARRKRSKSIDHCLLELQWKAFVFAINEVKVPYNILLGLDPGDASRFFLCYNLVVVR